MTLFLYRYNNYYNRIVKKESTISDYGDPLVVLSNTNFNPNDGIAAEHIFNYYGETPDYMVAANTDNTINSRWYVIEAVRTRGGQYKISLMRDVVADWYDEIVNAPCFIEKATLGVNNPLIFNSEQMAYNQIKQYEKPITDASKLPWYAIYVNKDFAHNFSFANTLGDYTPNITVSSRAAYTFDTFSTRPYVAAPTQKRFGIQVCDSWLLGTSWRRFYIGINIDNKELQTLDKGNYSLNFGEGVSKEPGLFDGAGGYAIANIGETSSESLLNSRDYVKRFATALKDIDLASGIPSTVEYDTSDIQSQAGLILLDESEQRLYRIHVKQTEDITKETWIPQGSAVYLQADTALTTESPNSPAYGIYDTYGSELFLYETKHPQYVLSYEDITPAAYTLDISSTRTHIEEQPYDVLLVPDGRVQYKLNLNGVSSFRFSDAGFANRFISTMLQKEETNKYIIDIQKLPYTPLADDLFLTDNRGTLMVINKAGSGLVEGKSYAVAANIDPEEQLYDVYGIVFFANTTSFKKRVKMNVPVPADAIEFKVANECDKYRIVSPNFNGQFEFSATKNGGITGFDISCTMIPYQPYIKVAPVFNNLYGQAFNDARGMICAGDFSVARTSSAWIDYKKNNKNYQEMFNRQIENMEVNNSIARIGETVNAIAGTASGATTGALAGGMMAAGHPAGFIAGGVIAGAASAGGGVADLIFNEKLRKEALDYTRDQFGFNLQNIQAIPYNITKLSSFTEDYKDFPILEYYTCTEVEKEALRSKIQYNGMTVGVIGTIASYIQPTQSYIKGKLIRLENIADDYHVADVISREINLGVFI